MEVERSRWIVHVLRRRIKKTANGLDVGERVLKKGEIKANYESLALSNLVMPFAEIGEDWGEQTGLGSENKCSVLNTLSGRCLLDIQVRYQVSHRHTYAHAHTHFLKLSFGSHQNTDNI